MKYFSTFSGIGGFELGIGSEHECVGFSEIDKYAIGIYKKHFPTHQNYGDITKINTDELPDFDMLCGGFPCQAFSVAGKRGGFNDTRGTLFFEIARILKAKQPRLVFLENVKGLTNHDGGRTFQTIISALDELGYDLQWQVLNSKNFGVPQNRERVFIIGNLRGTSRPQIFPFRGDGEETDLAIKRIAHMQKFRRYNQTYDASGIVESLDTSGGGGHQPCVVPTLRASDYKRGDNQTVVAIPVLTPDRLEKRQNGRRFKEDGEPAFTVTAQDRHGVVIKEATKTGYAIAEEGDSINLAVPNSATPRGRVGKGIAQTLDTGMQQYTLQGMRVRRLTPLECERLQSYPDGWTEGISDSQRYKTIGNGVTVNVIRAINPLNNGKTA